MDDDADDIGALLAELALLDRLAAVRRRGGRRRPPAAAAHGTDAGPAFPWPEPAPPSLAEALATGTLDRFRHAFPVWADAGAFERLLDALARGGPPPSVRPGGGEMAAEDARQAPGGGVADAEPPLQRGRGRHAAVVHRPEDGVVPENERHVAARVRRAGRRVELPPAPRAGMGGAAGEAGEARGAPAAGTDRPRPEAPAQQVVAAGRLVGEAAEEVVIADPSHVSHGRCAPVPVTCLNEIGGGPAQSRKKFL